MRCISILILCMVMSGSLTCLADQLQWNDRDVCERAVREIKREPILLSYCSLADEEHVEVWLVKRVDIVNTPAEGLFEIRVVGRRLYESKNAFSAGEYREPVDYIELKDERDSGWVFQKIDLAYVYLPAGSSSFRCLGTILGLQFLVELETMSLPSDLMKKITGRRNPGNQLNRQLIWSRE